MNKTKVLIVEDEPIVAMELKIELEKLQCEVTQMIHTYKKVLDSIKTNKPDIILMDIKLDKGQNGIELVQKIHNSYDIPVMYI